MSPQGKVVRVLHDGKKAGNVTAWGNRMTFPLIFFLELTMMSIPLPVPGKRG